MVRKIKGIKHLEFNRFINFGLAIISSITKGLSSEGVFIGILGLALLFNLFD